MKQKSDKIKLNISKNSSYVILR